MWHLLLVVSLFLLRWNSGECIVLMTVVLSSLAVWLIVIISFPSPFLPPLSFSTRLPMYFLNLLNWPIYFFLAFLFLNFPTPLCLPHLLGFHVASFYVRTLIITLFCTSNPSSCPARSPSTAQWFMGLWRALILLPAPLSLQLATRSKVCVWLFSSLFSLVSFFLNTLPLAFKSKSEKHLRIIWMTHF